MEPPLDAPPPPPPEPAEEDPYRCPRCGASHDPYQEYCLECGTRLVPLPGQAVGARRDVWTRESPVWFWASFLALLLVALIAGAIVLAATDDEEPRATTSAQRGPTTSVIAIPTDITTGTLPTTVVVPTLGTTTTVPTLGTTTNANGGTTTGTTTTSGAIVSWPSGRDGYTIILTSIPNTRSRGEAEAKAREAIADNLPQVGVLNSDDYTSLEAGYWVVFTGIYDTESQARGALPTARGAGWPIAYIREISED